MAQAEKLFFLLSDATGETAESILTAALTQFRGKHAQMLRIGNVRTRAQIRGIVARASEEGAAIFYTFVDHGLIDFTEALCKEHGVDCLDLLGPLIARLAKIFGESSQEKPGLLHGVDEDYFRRIEAMEFALKYDDGQKLQHLDEADIVLTGVSRTSKTPLSIYLSCRGWKVANVPLVHGIDPPPELFRADPGRVIGLVIDPKRLVERRTARLRSLGEERATAYIDFDEVKTELRWARALFRDRGWPVVNVTARSVEENAHEILVKLKLK